MDLFNQTSADLGGASEFFDTLVCLYALGAIELTEERQVVAHVGPTMV